MLKHAWFITAFVISSWGISLDEMVQETLLRNNDLKSLQYRINMAQEQIKLASKWQNPTLSLGVNDIQFDHADRRDLEPMQAQYIGFSQVIPMGDKIFLQEKMAVYDKQIAHQTLQNQKRILKSRVYELAYMVLILEKKLQFLNKYEQNIKTLEALLHGLYENGVIKQTDIMNVKVKISDIQLQKHTIQNQIKTLYLKLEQISYLSISSIEQHLGMEQHRIKLDIKNHPKINMLTMAIEKQRTLVELEMEKKTSDIKINMAYFQRDSKYEDYANISVSMPLSVYKTEETKALKARLKEKSMHYDLKTLKQNFKTQYRILQEQRETARKNYELLQKHIIPLKQRLQDTIESYNSLKQIHPRKAIENLNDVITYELKALNQMQNYFNAYSKQLYYVQGN